MTRSWCLFIWAQLPSQTTRTGVWYFTLGCSFAHSVFFFYYYYFFEVLFIYLFFVSLPFTGLSSSFSLYFTLSLSLHLPAPLSHSTSLLPLLSYSLCRALFYPPLFLFNCLLKFFLPLPIPLGCSLSLYYFPPPFSPPIPNPILSLSFSSFFLLLPPHSSPSIPNPSLTLSFSLFLSPPASLSFVPSPSRSVFLNVELFIKLLFYSHRRGILRTTLISSVTYLYFISYSCMLMI